jgi:phosphate transport system substrate-binding protein
MKPFFAVAFGAVLACCVSFSSLHAQALKVGSTGAAAGLLQGLVDRFVAQAPQHKVEVIHGLGSAGSIAAVAAGALDLAISSRDINDKERAQQVQSQALLETPYIFVSSTTVPLSLTLEEVVGYYAGTLRTYPNGTPVRLVLRPRNDSNTLYITKAVPGMAEAQEKARLRHDLPVAGTDQDNMQHLKSVEGAFSGMILTQLSTETNSLQRVRLNGVDGTLESMVSGAYPYKMTMYVVTGRTPNASTQAFQTFLASPEARAIIQKAGGKMISP